MHDQLAAYFDGELDAARGRAFEDHLADCPDCAQELAALRQMRTALRDESLRYRPQAGLEERIQSVIRVAGAEERSPG
ncbi:MAG TPA: zf-HC2 domain-containing protein, partial [Gemmataceae bacterium]